MSQPVDINQAVAVRTSMKVLQPGLYVIHYVDVSPTKSQVPLSLAQAPIRMAGAIEFICPEGVSQQTLAKPGDYLVVNVRQGNAVLAVSKYAAAALIDTAQVHWRVEPIVPTQKATAPASRASAAKSPARTYQPVTGIALTGHIERRGDVTVESGEWLGATQGRARLEGFQIDWSQRPEGIDIQAICWSDGQRSEGETGRFVGTRQKAKSIHDLQLALSGPRASQYRLTGEAVFSDGYRQSLGNINTSARHNDDAQGNRHVTAVTLQVERIALSQMSDQAPPNDKQPTPKSSWLDPEITHIADRAAIQHETV